MIAKASFEGAQESADGAEGGKGRRWESAERTTR